MSSNHAMRERINLTARRRRSHFPSPWNGCNSGIPSSEVVTDHDITPDGDRIRVEEAVGDVSVPLRSKIASAVVVKQ